MKIYATSEERKQRNRQAQAAFRERRTEYIKQLESTIKVHEDNLQSLQQSHRSAADECLMLRYKNSLLERVLLEKGKRWLYDLYIVSTMLTTVKCRHRCPSRVARKRWKPESRPIKNAYLRGTSQPTYTTLCSQQICTESKIVDRHVS